MCEHQNIVNLYTDSAPIFLEHFNGISEVFQSWSQAYGRSKEKCDTAKAESRKVMEKLWDTARGFPVRSAADMAALYIMAQNTPEIDPDCYLEGAWSIVSAASGEAELVHLYDTLRQLGDLINSIGLDDAASDRVGEVANGIEDQIAAIPATTARGLAIKADVFRDATRGSLGDQSLARDLAALTGYAERPVWA